ncbi:MAG: VWA domain-containing protein [Phycisphaerae bacterium]
MALRFRCSKCGKRLTVNESAGTEVVCPYCNQGTAVPADAEMIGGPAAALSAPAAQPAPEQKAEKGKEGEEEEAEEQTSMDTVMDWLALYLPSWGTSVVLHAAVLILAAFFAWQSYAVQPPFEYKSAVVAQSQKKTVKRQRPQTKMQDDEASRGKMVPRPSSLVRHMENPFPDVASNKMEVLEVIGVGGGGKEFGGFEGLGTGSGRGSGFFGAGGDEARKIVYVVDRSGSMTDSIDYVKFELKRSIGELGEEKEFHVVFYSSGPPVEMPTRRLVNATDRNKQLAFEFIDGIIPQGETDPSKALERAFEVKPELIYLLTDGEFDKAIVGLVKKQNAGGQVTVHTIGFLYRMGEQVLKQIAEENGGNYKFVSEKDLATLIH